MADKYYGMTPGDADHDGDVDEVAARYEAPQSNSTMRSDNIAMVEYLKQCPEKSMKEGKR